MVLPVLVVVAMGLGAPATAEAQTVTFDWICDGEQCFFDGTGSTTQNMIFADWFFGDGSYLVGTTDLDVNHDYGTTAYGDFYFDVTFRMYYYTWGIFEVECEIYFIRQQIGGTPLTSGTCS